MGGGARYPYPRQVWSPSGGWWTRPTNWVSNTAICTFGIAIATYGAWSISAEKEWRHAAPVKPIPSMLWARQFKEGELGVKEDP
ncbi:hypothetical protein BOTBODRAFT_37286 [Botryobasidium botryosum FD-172 SS1]|uniref:Uncharacterized protein n=1 Tax=Botryobasidium botryosum (strain FD-172 SS1) TaxID=930990 RepID=A0A067M0W1_BOTB1|nr:hypothetical protein BOTBODRAFT_37286 [Botryobasidium botryosum FD-172 SS1]